MSKNCGRRAENVTRSLRVRPSRRGLLWSAMGPGGFAFLSLIFMFSPCSSLCLTEPSFFAGSCQLPQDSTPGPVCSPRHTQMLLDFQTPPQPRSLVRAPTPRAPRGAWLCFLLFPAFSSLTVSSLETIPPRFFLAPFRAWKVLLKITRLLIG